MNVYSQENKICQLFSSKEALKHCHIDYETFNNKDMIIIVNDDGN